MEANKVQVETLKINPYLPPGTIDRVIITFEDGSRITVLADGPHGEDAAILVRISDK